MISSSNENYFHEYNKLEEELFQYEKSIKNRLPLNILLRNFSYSGHFQSDQLVNFSASLSAKTFATLNYGLYQLKKSNAFTEEDSFNFKRLAIKEECGIPYTKKDIRALRLIQDKWKKYIYKEDVLFWHAIMGDKINRMAKSQNTKFYNE